MSQVAKMTTFGRNLFEINITLKQGLFAKKVAVLQEKGLAMLNGDLKQNMIPISNKMVLLKK